MNPNEFSTRSPRIQPALTTSAPDASIGEKPSLVSGILYSKSEVSHDGANDKMVLFFPSKDALLTIEGDKRPIYTYRKIVFNNADLLNKISFKANKDQTGSSSRVTDFLKGLEIEFVRRDDLSLDEKRELLFYYSAANKLVYNPDTTDRSTVTMQLIGIKSVPPEMLEEINKLAEERLKLDSQKKEIVQKTTPVIEKLKQLQGKVWEGLTPSKL